MIIYAVNGSGAPNDPVKDGNFGRYLRRIADDASVERPHRIILLGGYTNRTDLSEAQAMQRWVHHHAPELGGIVRLLEFSTTARGNVSDLIDRTDEGVTIVYYCEYTRRWEMRFYLLYFAFWRKWKVRGVKFDGTSLKLKNAFARYFLATPQTILAEVFPSIRRKKERQRTEHVERERAKAMKNA